MNEVLLSEVFLKILNMSISASWLVLAVLLLRLVLKKAPKWVSVLLWGFVAIRLICPFSIESMLSLIPSAETVSPEIMMDWTPEISTGIGSVDTVINPIITQTFAPNPATSANPLQILIPVAGIFCCAEELPPQFCSEIISIRVRMWILPLCWESSSRRSICLSRWMVRIWSTSLLTRSLISAAKTTGGSPLDLFSWHSTGSIR